MPPKTPPVATTAQAKADDTQSNRVTIILSRALKITLEGVEHMLQKGANEVDAIVAKHWLVAEHIIGESASSGEADAKVVELEQRNADFIAQANERFAEMQTAIDETTARAEAAEAKVVELQSIVDAFQATAGAGQPK